MGFKPSSMVNRRECNTTIKELQQLQQSENIQDYKEEAKNRTVESKVEGLYRDLKISAYLTLPYLTLRCLRYIRYIIADQDQDQAS